MVKRSIRKNKTKLIKNIRLIAFDFDGVFTDNKVYVFEDGREAVRCCRADGIGLSLLKKKNIKPVVISSEKNPAVKHRCEKLDIEAVCACEDKLAALDGFVKALGISLKETAYMGNDINDLGPFKKAAFTIAVKDAHPSIRRMAKYVTKTKGGHGAVREVCELFTGIE